MQTHRDRVMLLNRIPEVGPLRMQRLLQAFGDVDGVWRANEQELAHVSGISLRLARRIAAGRQDARGLDAELGRVKAIGARVITLEDAEYPAPLRQIPDPPVALYIRGRLPEQDPMVAIVGTRRASLYGQQTAGRLAGELALRGVTVVSGLARGIDAAAHWGALRVGGKTVAVLGSGLGRVYPPEHAKLAEQMIEGGGAVISEYPMQTAPLAQNFPRRNRLISGLSLGVLVVEAAARSGALITADMALEQGREVFAIPGPISTVTSLGTNELVKQGARVVTSVEDIINELGLIETPMSGQDKHMEHVSK